MLNPLIPIAELSDRCVDDLGTPLLIILLMIITTLLYNKLKTNKCKYHKTCPSYYKSSYTCNHGGGGYCGKYREYEMKT